MENAKILTVAQLEAIEKLAEMATELVMRIKNTLEAVVEVVLQLWRAFVENYHNKRVVHLAVYHKDPLVRKKNRNRIARWLRRYIRCKE